MMPELADFFGSLIADPNAVPVVDRLITIIDREFGKGWNKEAQFGEWLFPLEMEEYIHAYKQIGGLKSWDESYIEPKEDKPYFVKSMISFLFEGNVPKPEIIGFLRFFIEPLKSGRCVVKLENWLTDGTVRLLCSKKCANRAEAEFRCAWFINNELLRPASSRTWPAIPRIPIGCRPLGSRELGEHYNALILIKSKTRPFLYKLCQDAAEAKSDPDYDFYIDQIPHYALIDKAWRKEPLTPEEESLIERGSRTRRFFSDYDKARRYVYRKEANAILREALKAYIPSGQIFLSRSALTHEINYLHRTQYKQFTVEHELDDCVLSSVLHPGRQERSHDDYLTIVENKLLDLRRGKSRWGAHKAITSKIDLNGSRAFEALYKMVSL